MTKTRCVACGVEVGEDFHTRGEAACCNRVQHIVIVYIDIIIQTNAVIIAIVIVFFPVLHEIC